MTQALSRLTNALNENGHPVPDQANVTILAGDLRQLLQLPPVTTTIPVLDRIRSAD